jgi:hypothetical protein
VRSQEFYLEIALAALIVFLAFSGIQILDVALRPQEVPTLLPQRLQETTPTLLEDTELRELFPAAYPDEELLAFRDIFEVPPQLLVATLPEETVKYSEGTSNVVVQQGVEAGGASAEKEPAEMEKQPEIKLKGVVLSPQGQVVLLEIDGRIEFLTPEKPLSLGIKLVKVKEKEVVLEYQGREMTLNLTD